MNEYPVIAIGANGLPYLFFRHFLARIPMEEDQRRLQIGDKAQTLQPWYDTVRQVWDVYATAFDGANWLPARELPVSTGRCYMQSGAAMQGQSLIYFWPSDGRTYEDPHVRSAQLRYAEFPEIEKPAGAARIEHDSLRTFERGGCGPDGERRPCGGSGSPMAADAPVPRRFSPAYRYFRRRRP